MTQAQIKRDRQLTETLTNQLNRTLRDFKDKYLTDYYNYQVKQLEATKNHYAKLIQSDDIEAIAKKNYFGSAERYIKELNWKIDTINTTLSRQSLLMLEHFVEADKSYQVKLDNLISKIVEEQFNTRFMKIERIGSGTYDKFSILISNDVMEIEARFIYACGEIKAPHYRFIITKRMK